jgi:hypothetical protein
MEQIKRFFIEISQISLLALILSLSYHFYLLEELSTTPAILLVIFSASQLIVCILDIFDTIRLRQQAKEHWHERQRQINEIRERNGGDG